jgi:alanine racemase
MRLKTWVEVSGSALLQNINELKKTVGANVKILAVVKGNAYGASINAVVSVTRLEVDWYGVDSLEEGILTRALCDNPILVLGYVSAHDAYEIVKNKLSVNIYNYDLAVALSQVATSENPTRVHIKVDSGLIRLGCFPEEAINLIEKISKLPNIYIEGLFTHYAKLLGEDDCEIYLDDLNELNCVVTAVKKSGLNPQLMHSASSGAAMLFEKTRLDMVRLGISLYGLWGRKHLSDSILKKVDLSISPVISWKTTIVNLKMVPANTGVGYNLSERVSRDTIVAVLGAGYYDGIDKRYGKIGSVLINGRRAKILGSIAMTMCTVDVTDIEAVKVGDVAVLIGKDGNEEITAYEFAEVINTSTYEVISRINPLLPRIVI